MTPTEFLEAKYSSTNGQSCPAVRASGGVAYPIPSTTPSPSEKLRINHPAVSKVALFAVCFPGVTTPCGCIFHSPVAGFSLTVFEVS